MACRHGYALIQRGPVLLVFPVSLLRAAGNNRSLMAAKISNAVGISYRQCRLSFPSWAHRTKDLFGTTLGWGPSLPLLGPYTAAWDDWHQQCNSHWCSSRSPRWFGSCGSGGVGSVRLPPLSSTSQYSESCQSIVLCTVLDRVTATGQHGPRRYISSGRCWCDSLSKAP